MGSPNSFLRALKETSSANPRDAEARSESSLAVSSRPESPARSLRPILRNSLFLKSRRALPALSWSSGLGAMSLSPSENEPGSLLSRSPPRLKSQPK